MKNNILIFLLCITLVMCSCNSNNSTTEIEKNFYNDTTISETTIYNLHKNEFSTNVENNNSGGYVSIVDGFLNALIEKDEAKLKELSHYCEGQKGFLYKVNFESYDILEYDEVTPYADNGCDDVYYQYTVGVNITDSTDDRFPVGYNVWEIQIAFGISPYIVYFIPKDYNFDGKCGIFNLNSQERIAYSFSHAYSYFDTIEDMNNLPKTIGETAFLQSSKNFLYAYYNSEITDFITAKKYLQLLLDVPTNLLDTSFSVPSDYGKELECDLYFTITEENDDFLDVVYYADSIFLTPAKKIRYYFNTEKQLYKTEILDDYGYNPLILYYGDR